MIERLIADFSNTLDVNKLLRDIAHLIAQTIKVETDKLDIATHMRLVLIDESMEIECRLIGGYGWYHQITKPIIKEAEGCSASCLVVRGEIPILFCIDEDKHKTYRQLIEKSLDIFKLIGTEKEEILKKIDAKYHDREIKEDFSKIFNAAKSSCFHIFPITIKREQEKEVIGVLHLYSNYRILSEENKEIIFKLMEALSLPLASFRRHYIEEEKLLAFTSALNEYLEGDKPGEDLMNLIVNKTADFFNVDECYLSLIYKERLPSRNRYIQMVESKNIREERIPVTVEYLNKQQIFTIEDFKNRLGEKLDFDNLGFPKKKDLKNDDLESLLRMIYDGAKRKKQLEEETKAILDVSRRFGLRRLCAKLGKMIIYNTKESLNMREEINFRSILNRPFSENNHDNIEQIEKEAKRIVVGGDLWWRYKAHLVFFENSNCTSYTIIHAPLIVLEDGRKKVIGILTIENKLDFARNVSPQLFSEHEINSFKDWANSISYAIQAKKNKILLQQIMDHSPQGIIFSDISGSILKVSKRAKEILSISQEKNVKHVQEIYDKEALHHVSRNLRRATKKMGDENAWVDGCFVQLKTTDNRSALQVQLSVYNIPNFLSIPTFPREGTIGFFSRETLATMKEVIQKVFEAIKKGGVDIDKVLAPIVLNAAEILNVEGNDASVFKYYAVNPYELQTDERFKKFIEEEKKRIKETHLINYKNSDDIEDKGKSGNFNLQTELDNSRRPWGILKHFKQEEPKYLILPRGEESVSYAKEGLTAYTARTKNKLRLDKKLIDHPSRADKEGTGCDSVLIVPIIGKYGRDQDKLLGVFKARNKEIEGKRFTEVDESFTEIFAGIISFLFTEMKERSKYITDFGIEILDLILKES